MRELKTFTTGKGTYDSFPDKTARAELLKKLTRPATAQVGDYLRIKAISADGSMEMEAVPAPESGGGVPGENGITPHIGENGNWWIGETDTGVSAEGEDGMNGDDGFSPTITLSTVSSDNWFDGGLLGERGIKITVQNKDSTDEAIVLHGKNGSDGVGIASIEQTATSTADGGDNVFTVTLTNGSKATFTVKNGSTGAAGKDGQDGNPGKDGTDGVSVTHEWNGTVLKVTSASGTSSADLKGEPGRDGNDGAPGSNGADGQPGKDGTSPVVSTLAITGGHRITITDVNGTKTVDVMDGVDGDKGDKGDKGDTGATGATGPAGADGKDYVLTAADKTEIAEQVENATIVQAPRYVETVEEMTDTSRPYVLASTGHIWAYMDTTTEQEVTKTDVITATDENPYKDGNRLGSSGDAYNADATGYHITPLIDLTKYAGKTVELHLEGCQYASTGTYAQWIQCRTYGYDKAVLAARPYTADVGTDTSYLMGGTAGITVKYNSATSATLTTKDPTYGGSKIPVGYMRFCGKGAVADSNIYITYPDTEMVTGGQWVDTGTTYAPTLTEKEKQLMVEEVAALVDAQLLDMIGDGTVTV